MDDSTPRPSMAPHQTALHDSQPLRRQRRRILGTLASLTMLAPGLGSPPLLAAPMPRKPMEDRLQRLEQESGGRLGVCLLDTAQGRIRGWRADTRFLMCSTFKFLLAAQALDAVDRGITHLGTPLPLTPDDLLPWAPVMATRIDGPPPSVEEAVAAALIHSDNTAANLLLTHLGGPQALTAFLRSQGDRFTRLDRREPALNQRGTGSRQNWDTTTPRAMVGHLQRFLLEDRLSLASRIRLETWMNRSETGQRRLRAGLPATWTVADKTGTGDGGDSHDIALIRPPGRAPLLLATYLHAPAISGAEREQTLARVGAWVTTGLETPA